MNDVSRPYDLIIFDCDGVLVDSAAIEEAVTVSMLAEFGLVLPKAELDRRHRGAIDEDFWSVLAFDYTRTFPADVVTMHRMRRLAALSAGVRAVDGAAELLDRLKSAGQPCCVASNG